MTGEPKDAPPRRKIQALTVSVNYADFLECIAPNVRHFERWLVVTDAKDTRTQEVCHRYGMEVLISKRLYENDAAFHKAAALNEGLEALDQDGWVAVMDSDILLPQDFRIRLDAQSLDPLCLYGLGGRRVCKTLHEFETIAANEPWADNLIHTSFVIGYFNLFHLGQEHNRYPEGGSDDASTYDVEFSNAFPAVRRRYLPIVCLHAGDASVNWRGRVTDPFFEEGTFHDREPVVECTEEAASRIAAPGGKVAQIGCYRGALTQTLSRHFGDVLVIDHWGLHLNSPSESLVTDLKFLSDRYARQTAHLANVSPPLEHSDETLAEIPNGSLDTIWLTGEPEYDFLLTFLPAWLPKLKPGGAIAGGFFDPQHLPAPSRVVQLLLGKPDMVFPDMQWIRYVATPSELAARLSLPPATDHPGRGVVYGSTSEDDVEALLVSLSSLRRRWDGAVCVLCAGDESASLRLACLKLSVEFRNVPATARRFSDDLNRLYALEWSPFEESLFIDTNTLVQDSPRFFFDALADADNAFCLAHGLQGTPVSSAAFAWRNASTVIDAWRAMAAAMFSVTAGRSTAQAIAMMRGDNALHILPGMHVWSGPAKRAPSGVPILALPRLGRAGALHLYPPWAEEEQAVLTKMAQTA